MIKKVIYIFFMLCSFIYNVEANDPIIPTVNINNDINVSMPDIQINLPQTNNISESNERGSSNESPVTVESLDADIARIDDLIDKYEDSNLANKNEEIEKLLNQREEKAMLANSIENEQIKNAEAAANKEAQKLRNDKCDSKGNCLDRSSFKIETGTFLPGFSTSVGSNTSEVINYTLGTIIQKLMVALGVLAVLIMTVGAGYIIMYHGQDELLSKGKSIFMAGVTALIVALSSYYLVSILRFVLYN